MYKPSEYVILTAAVEIDRLLKLVYQKMHFKLQLVVR